MITLLTVSLERSRRRLSLSVAHAVQRNARKTYALILSAPNFYIGNPSTVSTSSASKSTHCCIIPGRNSRKEFTLSLVVNCKAWPITTVGTFITTSLSSLHVKAAGTRRYGEQYRTRTRNIRRFFKYSVVMLLRHSIRKPCQHRACTGDSHLLIISSESLQTKSSGNFSSSRAVPNSAQGSEAGRQALSNKS